VIDFPELWRRLDAIGLGSWRESLQPLLEERLAPSAHGDMPGWLDALERLPGASAAESRELLLRLSPWRKGPFALGEIDIDAEWRSDLKWARVKDAIGPLEGRSILDVGCGNGYYALRMQEAGAGTVVGIDPTLLYVVQFLAVARFLETDRVSVLPLRLSELPAGSRAFDSVFSMGVLYHQRSPLDHLRELRGQLRRGGQFVLETLYLPGEEACARTPPGRYARMRNVWLLPTVPELETWLHRTGFTGIRVVDRSVTTADEQRSTPWMTFESLREALDPADPGCTVEGWPAPRRVLVIAISP
jgi:tRNA (mo5U34)-methyltransferase